MISKSLTDRINTPSNWQESGRVSLRGREASKIASKIFSGATLTLLVVGR